MTTAPNTSDISHTNCKVPQFLIELFSGLLEPSATALAIALSTVLLTFAAASLILTQQFMVRYGDQYFANGPLDYDIFATVRAISLAQSHTQSPKLIIAGGSTTRAALLESDLASYLDASRVAIEIYKLCTSRQTIWESAAFLDMIPDRTAGVVILGIAPTLFTHGFATLKELRANPRVGFRSKFFDSELVFAGITPPLRLGLYAFDNALFFVPRISLLAQNILRGGGPHYQDTQYIDKSPVSESRWVKHGSIVGGRLARYDENVTNNLAVLERILTSLQERTTLAIILVDTPINPRFLNEFTRRDLYVTHSARMREFANRMNVSYLNLNETPGYLERDFYDWGHLRNRTAMEKSASAAIRVILPHLKRLKADG